jgi:DNA-binding FadR family transcriptional regulator
MTIKKPVRTPPRKASRGASGSPQRNLNSHLVRAMGERILSNEFAPGTLLPNEAQWSKSFGASRTAVREAIKSLIAKGLVTSRPKIGSRVEPRTRWNLMDRDVLDWHHAAVDRLSFVHSTQEARRLVEPGIAALAARKHSLDQLDRLIEAVKDMAKARTVKAMNAADLEFHLALLAAANNDLMMPFGIVIEKALGTLFEFTAPRTQSPAHVVALHERIAKAIGARDEKAAREAMLALLSDTDAIVAGKRAKPR